MFWECLANDRNEDPIINTTKEYAYRARQGHVMQAGFWLRGLAPRTWTYMDTEIQSYTKAWGIYTQQWPIELGLDDVLGLGGSGGKYTSDSRARRIGWALIVLNTKSLEVTGGVYGVMAGVQTVPRAELHSYKVALQATSGDACAITDCDYVFKGARRSSS